MSRMYVFKRLLQYVAKYRSKLILIALLGLIGVAFEVAKPLPIKLVIDNVLSNQPLPGFLSGFFGDTSFIDNKKTLLYICVAAMVLIALCSFVFSLIIFGLTVGMAQRLVFDLMIDFFAKLQRLTVSFYSKNKVGDLLQRMN